MIWLLSHMEQVDAAREEFQAHWRPIRQYMLDRGDGEKQILEVEIRFWKQWLKRKVRQ